MSEEKKKKSKYGFDHDNKNFLKALNLTREESDKAFNRFKNLMKYIESKDIHSEKVEFIMELLEKGDTLENALLIDQLVHYIHWITGAKINVINVPMSSPKPASKDAPEVA